jgi:phosphoserine phosphatase RsbU/P
MLELRSEKEFPLGLMDSDYSEVEVQLEPGDGVLLYSDGLLEATNSNGEEFGISGLKQAFQHPDASAQSMLKDVKQFAHGGTLADDATAVALRR